MDILLYIAIPITLLYALLIESLSLAWFKTSSFSCEKQTPATHQHRFSIIIPFRNEEHNLENLLHDIEAQHYPTALYEIVFINDDSTDQSVIKLQSLIDKSTLSCKLLHSSHGKKKAVQKGLFESTADYIIQLDADTRISSDLINCYNSYFQNTEAKLIAAPVGFTNGTYILSKLMSLEFISLITSGAAAISLGKPMMLNAANMGYERKIALEFHKEVYESEVASGDDQFLMEAIERKYGASSIRFMKSTKAIAITTAPGSLSEFFNQRIRWASKTSSYTSRFSQIVAVLIFLFNFIVLGSFVISIIQQCALPFLILYGVKLLIDLPILLSGSFFFRQQKNMLYYPLLQFLYPWYIVIVAAWSLFGGYSWKGRKY